MSYTVAGKLYNMEIIKFFEITFFVLDLPSNSYEKCQSYDYSPCSLPQYFADLENIKIVDKYTLVNDKVSKQRSINIVQVKPTYLMLPPVGKKFSFDLTKDYDPNVNWVDLSVYKIVNSTKYKYIYLF